MNTFSMMFAHGGSHPRISGVDPDTYRDAIVSAEILWELRNDPFGNLDNCQMQDMEVAESELRYFRDLGGVSIVETTSISIGRDLTRLRELSIATGLNVIAGTGFYLDSSQTARNQGKLRRRSD